MLQNVNVITAVNGDLAVQQAQRNLQQFYQFFNDSDSIDIQKGIQELPKHFDIIILDLSMPIMDGFEACKRIVKLYDQFKTDHIGNVNNKLRDSDE